MTHVPKSIREAAESITTYFAERGASSWVLGGIQSRDTLTPAKNAPRIIDATYDDLHRAIASKDDPPTDPARVVAETVQHLGFCCLGNREIRLTLPNGRRLRVRLE